MYFCIKQYSLKLVFFILLLCVCFIAFSQNQLKQANTAGSEIIADAPYHIQKYDSLGNINSIPLHVFVHASSCVGCNNELMNIVVKIKNASDSQFVSTLLFDDYTNEEFNNLFVNKSQTDLDFGIQSFEQSLPLKDASYTVNFTSDSHFFPSTTYTDITKDYWWFTMMIPADKLLGYEDVIDLEVYFELDWDPDYVCYLRVFRQTDAIPKVDGWLRGDVHYHGMFTQNDAEVGLPLDGTKLMAEYCGLDWITITDHSCDYDNYGSDMYSNWTRLGNIVGDQNSQDDAFVFIRGIEMTVKNSADDQIHALVYPSAENPLAMPYFGDGDGDTFGTDVNVEMLSDSLVFHQSFAYAAHPFSQGDKLSFAVDGSVWNLGDASFPENDEPHEYFGTVICNDINTQSDIFSDDENKLLKNNIIGGEIWNLYSNLKTTGEKDDPWDVKYSGNHGFELFPEDDNLNTTNRFMQNFEVAEFIWKKGLQAKNNNDLIENWKFNISAGSDAHGSFNYSTTDFFMGVSGFVSDNAIGKLSSLTYCPQGAGNNGENVLNALKNGNLILSSGPIIGFEIDTDDQNETPEIIIGNDAVLDYNAAENSILRTFAASSEEYGDVVSKRLLIKTETENYVYDLPVNTDDWTIGLTEILSEVFWTPDAALDQWFLMRAELKTTKNYSNPQIYRCETVDFYSYTNPIWLKINSPNNSTVYSQNLDFKFFPNPAKKSIKIEFPYERINGKISIINSLGQVVYCEEISGNIKVDLKNLESGIYFVKFESKDLSNIKKLVVL